MALFNIDSISGVLSFDEAPDFESYSSAYSIELTVTDGMLSDSQSKPVDISILVSNVTRLYLHRFMSLVWKKIKLL